MMNIEDKIIENLINAYPDIDVFLNNISEFDLIYLKEIIRNTITQEL